MSVYKILIGKDMAPQNKNTSHIYIWEEFFNRIHCVKYKTRHNFPPHFWK